MVSYSSLHGKGVVLLHTLIVWPATTITASSDHHKNWLRQVRSLSAKYDIYFRASWPLCLLLPCERGVYKSLRKTRHHSWLLLFLKKGLRVYMENNYWWTHKHYAWYYYGMHSWVFNTWKFLPIHWKGMVIQNKLKVNKYLHPPQPPPTPKF